MIARLMTGGILLAGTGLSATAQEAPNPLLTFSFSSSLNVSDNYDLSKDPKGTTTYLDNDLGLTYLTETETQRLLIGASGVLRLADYPERGNDTDFDNTTLRFEYGLFGADSQINAIARYNRADIAFFDPLNLVLDEDFIDEDDLVVTTGYRETLNGSVNLRTGLQSPLGFSLGLSTRQRNFIDTVDPSLYDTASNTVSAGLIFTLSAVTEVTLDGLYRLYSADDLESTDRDTRSLSLGASHALARGLTLTGSLGYQEIETTEELLGLSRVTNDDGLIGSFGALQEMPNGTLGLNVNHSINTSGQRTSLNVSRDMDLPGGELALSFGVSRGESGKTNPVGSLKYVHELAQGNISALLSQRFSTNSNDEDLQVTSAVVNWNHDLSPLSGVSLRLGWVETNAEDGSDDRQRGSLRASYRHSLTEDWDLRGGYEYTQLNRTSGDAQENTLFLTIGRQFQYRP